MLNFSTYHHIYNHANGDDNLFREEKNYDFFLKKYHQHIDPIADTIAWCLMKNHFHLLIKIKSEAEVENDFSSFFSSSFSKVSNFRKAEKTDEIEERKSKFLSRQFSNFFSSYSQAFNKVYERRGSLFIKNFKRKEISNEQYLFQIILYIHLNPVKHGFVQNVNDWKHSSFQSFFHQNLQLATALFYNEGKYVHYHHEKGTQYVDYQKMENELT